MRRPFNNEHLFLEIVDAIVVHFLAVRVHALDLEVATLVIKCFAEFGYAMYACVTDLRDDKTRMHIGLIAQDAVRDVGDDYTSIEAEFRCVIFGQIGEIGPE